VSFDPYQPYGRVLETTVRVVTWNVWGCYGDWQARQAELERTLSESRPDVVCLAESWSRTGESQADRVAAALGVEYSIFHGGWTEDDWTSGIAVVSRWPITRHELRPLPGDGDALGSVVVATIDGPRGLLEFFVVMLDYPLDGSARRQAQVRQLAEFVVEKAHRGNVTVVCGDFNAGPDSDEMRMLTGRSATAAAGLVFYDAWEIAGDGSAGITWSNANPLAAAGCYPDRRFDYILSAWPRAHAAGHPRHCELLGVTAGERPEISDHYGVLADLRY
jgi:endonuclease/exonuclease/phosphatase family metal-dependent hydrolase